MCDSQLIDWRVNYSFPCDVTNPSGDCFGMPCSSDQFCYSEYYHTTSCPVTHRCPPGNGLECTEGMCNGRLSHMPHPHDRQWMDFTNMALHFCKRMANSSWAEPELEPEPESEPETEPEPESEPEPEPQPQGTRLLNHEWMTNDSLVMQCAPSFIGTPSVTACSADSRHYIFSGCTTLKCAAPDPTQCRDTPGWMSFNGYSCTEVASYYGCSSSYACSQSTHWEFSVDQGQYIRVCGGVSAHEACCECGGGSSLEGYNVSEIELDVSLGFNVSATCSDGYFGSPVVTPCAIDGATYGLSGCEPMCILPAETPGYIVHLP